MGKVISSSLEDYKATYAFLWNIVKKLFYKQAQAETYLNRNNNLWYQKKNEHHKWKSCWLKIITTTESIHY